MTPRLAAACSGPIDALLDPELFKGLCDRTRSKLLGCLAKCGRPCSVSELAECCLVDFSVVSRHLALLARSGIVASIKKGRTVFYAVRYTHMTERLRALADALENYDPDFARTRRKGTCFARR